LKLVKTTAFSAFKQQKKQYPKTLLKLGY